MNRGFRIDLDAGYVRRNSLTHLLILGNPPVIALGQRAFCVPLLTLASLRRDDAGAIGVHFVGAWRAGVGDGAA